MSEERNPQEEALESEPEGGESRLGSEANESEPEILTEEDVKEMGLGKGFVGKPISILKDVYREQNKQFTQMKMTVSDIQKQFEDFKKVDLTQKEMKEVQEKVDEKLPEMPDPMDDPEGFKVWQQKRDDLLESKIIKKFESKLKESDNSQTVQELVREKNAAILVDELQQELSRIYGEDYNFALNQSVRQEYNDYLMSKSEEQQKRIISTYAGDPKGLAEAILQFHYAKNFKSGKTGKNENKNEKELHDKKVEQAKNKNQKFTKNTSSPRDKAKEPEDYSPYKKLAEEGEKLVLGEE